MKKLFRYRRFVCVRTFNDTLKDMPHLSKYGFREATVLDVPAIGQIHYRIPLFAWLTYKAWNRRSYRSCHGYFAVMYGEINRDGSWKITKR